METFLLEEEGGSDATWTQKGKKKKEKKEKMRKKKEKGKGGRGRRGEKRVEEERDSEQVCTGTDLLHNWILTWYDIPSFFR